VALTDKALMTVFLEQKAEGAQTSNGGWKTWALNAAAKAFKGSERTSGGAPKTASSICSHWKELKGELRGRPKEGLVFTKPSRLAFLVTFPLGKSYHILIPAYGLVLAMRSDGPLLLYSIYEFLLSRSGWGWDSENQCVKADDEQWDVLIAEHGHLASYKNKPFPIYKDMRELRQGALATGSLAFHPGKDYVDDSDTSFDSGKEADTSIGDISVAKVHSKRKFFALDTLMPKKGTRHDRTGRTSTSDSILTMSQSISEVTAAVMSSGDDTIEQAVALIKGTDGFSDDDKSVLFDAVLENPSFGKILLSVSNPKTHIAYMRRKLL
ncbi:hypothetical protein K435DRAFT_814295, partial [Dendrothele bispora CBS 962.96]